MNIIEEFLENASESIRNGPTDWQFDQMDKIVDAYESSIICSEIFKQYDPKKHNRHTVALMFSMLIWHSSAHDLAVSAYLKNWYQTNDVKLIGVAISKQMEWYPFGTAKATLQGIKELKDKFPEFGEDYNFWENTANKEINKESA